MSTRANIIIKEKGSYTDNNGKQKNYSEKLYFYRHSDGYPEGTMPLLVTFINAMREGKIRNNVGQSAGWLIMLGAVEYNSIPKFELEPHAVGRRAYGDVTTTKFSEEDFSGWKVGAIEPTTGIHGDIEYKYVIDVKTMDITCYERRGNWNKPKWVKTPIINIAGYKPHKFKGYFK